MSFRSYTTLADCPVLPAVAGAEFPGAAGALHVRHSSGEVSQEHLLPLGHAASTHARGTKPALFHLEQNEGCFASGIILLGLFLYWTFWRAQRHFYSI